MKKFRPSFSRESKDEGARPTPPMNFKKMPSLREKRSKATLGNNGTGEDSHGESQASTPRRKAMQDFLQRTGENLRATGSNIKARGAQLPRIPRKKSKVAKPSSRRNSAQVQVRTMDIPDDLLDKIMGAPREKQASAAFLNKQRARVRARKSSSISPLSERLDARLDGTPLSADEVRALFVGAPCFSVLERDGRYMPRVAFHGGGGVAAAERFSADYAGLGHASFKACTLGVRRDGEGADHAGEYIYGTEAAELGIDLLEVPSMLSATGFDPGTIGFEHFLQLPISDSALQADGEAPLEKRRLLQTKPKKLGLRKVSMEALIARLSELGELQTSSKEGGAETTKTWNESKIEEMGEELFGKLLSAELGTTPAGTGSVALKTQISALQKVLGTTGLWHDFSLVEWRIRVGQLLWAAEDTGEDDEDRSPLERDVLLLQITLAAELAVRIRAAKTLCHSIPHVITKEDCTTLEAERTTKIKWDLLLASRFLSNLNISAKLPTEGESNKKANRSSLFSTITYLTATESTAAEDPEPSVQPILTPKNQERQLEGLARFAEILHWPHAQDVRSDLQAKLSPHTSRDRPISIAETVYATPLSSPMFPPLSGSGSPSFSKPPLLRRTTTAQSMQLLPARGSVAGLESFEVGGWLSRSWLSGLVMPGEAAVHFLISTLLENSPQAITALGDAANLYGGFVYEGRGFWSTSCVVGRVLGAAGGAVGCMGWVSVPEGSDGVEDGWVDVDVKELPGVALEPRIKGVGVVAKESDPLCNQDASTLRASDFTTPNDGPLVTGNDLRYDGLSFVPVNISPEVDNASESTSTADPTQPSLAILTFHSPTDSKVSKISVPLTYDVHFISSYPCHPEPSKPPRSPPKPQAPSPQLSTKIKIENEINTPKDDAKDKPKKPAREDDDLTALPALPRSTSSENSDDVAHTPTTEGAPAPVGSSPTSKTTSPSNPSSSPQPTAKDLPALPAHPLHNAHTFQIIPVAHLLSLSTESRPRILSPPLERTKPDNNIASKTEDTIILDCRGPEDLELLARAWCAKVGENALVGRSGRTCLGCCVREARAVGVGVVIWR